MVAYYISKLIEYVSWPGKKYQEMRSLVKDAPAYEIKDINLINGAYQLLILISGTGKTVPYLPYEIAEDFNLLKEFSGEDIRLIHYLNFEEMKKPKYAIVGHKFSENGKIILCIKNRESSEIKDFTASELTIHKDILKQCSPEDAHRIGYFYGTEN